MGHSQSLIDLNTKALRWLGTNTTVQIVVVVKIWNTFGGNNHIRLLAMRYQRGAANPVFAVSFGTHRLHYTALNTLTNQILGGTPLTGVGEVDPATNNPYPACNGGGIAQYQFRIPTPLLFNGVPGGVPLAAPLVYNIDLHSVQTDVIASSQ